MRHKRGAPAVSSEQSVTALQDSTIYCNSGRRRARRSGRRRFGQRLGKRRLRDRRSRKRRFLDRRIVRCWTGKRRLRSRRFRKLSRFRHGRRLKTDCSRIKHHAAESSTRANKYVMPAMRLVCRACRSFLGAADATRRRNEVNDGHGGAEPQALRLSSPTSVPVLGPPHDLDRSQDCRRSVASPSQRPAGRGTRLLFGVSMGPLLLIVTSGG